MEQIMRDFQREMFEASVIERLKESGFLEMEIRVECLARCDEGYQDELINSGWHYWNAAIAATPTPQASSGVTYTQAECDEMCEIAERDGYEKAVQEIDQKTGGDGEYRYCLGMEDSARHTPDAPAMIQRIVDRFEVLNLLDEATKTGSDQPDDSPVSKMMGDHHELLMRLQAGQHATDRPYAASVAEDAGDAIKALVAAKGSPNSRSGWTDINDEAQSAGRILLLWKPIGGVKEHVELGWWSAGKGVWVNTYGKAFSFPPDQWSPLAPYTLEGGNHPDDIAVDRFAAAMKSKLAKKRAQGFGGWNDPVACPIDYLKHLLVEQIRSRAVLDPVDIGNFAMMIFNRGETPSHGR